MKTKYLGFLLMSAGIGAIVPTYLWFFGYHPVWMDSDHLFGGMFFGALAILFGFLTSEYQ